MAISICAAGSAQSRVEVKDKKGNKLYEGVINTGAFEPLDVDVSLMPCTVYLLDNKQKPIRHADIYDSNAIVTASYQADGSGSLSVFHRQVLIDIYFLVDATGSMSAAIDNVKQEMQAALANLQKNLPSWSIGAGLAWYRDKEDGDRDIYDNVLGITTDPTDFADALDQLTATGGGDVLEAQMYALSTLAKQEFINLWRENSDRYVVWFGDAGGEAPLHYGGDDYTLDTTINVLNEHGIKVIAFNMAQSGEGINYKDQAMIITSATNGGYLAKVNPRKVTRFMYDVIQSRLKNTIE